MPPASVRVVLLLALLAAGCGKGSSKPAHVQGTVYYHGVPLQGGTIVFTPDADRGGSGPIAHAEIRPGGAYTLRTEEGPGVPAGWHRVTVAPGGSGVALPPRYCDPELSGLEREVKPDSVNIIDIRLD
jgi:hypothetical protein